MPEPTAEPAPTPEPEKPQERAYTLAVNAVPCPAVPVEEPAARPMPLAALIDPQVKVEGDEVAVTIGPRQYRVLGLDKCTSRGQMRVNVKVSGRNVRGDFCYHGDTLDMEAFRQRAAFVKQAAH